MPKNPNRRPKILKKDEPLTGTMKFFLAGCVAELYLLIIRRCYVNGAAQAQIDWYDSYLPALMGVGTGVLVLGAVLSYLWRADGKKRVIGWYLTGGGAFLALSALLIWRLNAPMVTFLTIAVFAAMILGILWSLYDRECAISLTILGVSLIFLWVCRRGMSNIHRGMAMRMLALVFLVALAGIAYLAWKAEKNGGRLGDFRILPSDADFLPVYTACALSAVGVAAAIISSMVAYYAMWGLAIVVFALAVYYTVKQL